MRFNPAKCAKCGNPKMIRFDKVPFCSECEKKLKADFAKLRPDLAKKDLTFVSEQVDK